MRRAHDEMIRPASRCPDGRFVVGVFSDPVVARGSAELLRETRGRKVRERWIRASGCASRVWMVVDLGSRKSS